MGMKAAHRIATFFKYFVLILVGLIMSLCEKPEYEEARKAMGLNENAKILLISTEGNTDPEHYDAVTR